jgi:hypothetical protein
VTRPKKTFPALPRDLRYVSRSPASSSKQFGATAKTENEKPKTENRICRRFRIWWQAERKTSKRRKGSDEVKECTEQMKSPRDNDEDDPEPLCDVCMAEIGLDFFVRCDTCTAYYHCECYNQLAHITAPLR